MPRVVIPLATGFEEIEAVTIIDILRRAGAEVIACGLTGEPVQGSHRITVHVDAAIDEIDPADVDLVVLPGGLPGTTHLQANTRVRELVRAVKANGKMVGAICAAPAALASFGVLEKHRATGHPSVMKMLGGATALEERVVVDGPVVTSRAAGTAMEFAFTLVERLFGREKVEELNRGILARL